MSGKTQKGFTLLELMIVVVIIAILAAFAMYNYARYGYRARRTDGQNFLQQIAAAEERYYTNHNLYLIAAADLSKLGFSSANSTQGYYSVALAKGPTGDNLSYTLTATPLAGTAQAGDTKWCPSLSLSSDGSKSPSPTTDTGNGKCW